MDEGVAVLLGSNQARNVSHVGVQVRANGVRNLTEAFVVQVTRIGTVASNDQLWPEFQGLCGQLVVVNQTSGRIYLVLLTFPEQCGSGNLFRGRVKTMR